MHDRLLDHFANAAEQLEKGDRLSQTPPSHILEPLLDMAEELWATNVELADFENELHAQYTAQPYWPAPSMTPLLEIEGAGQ